ncbi:MAG: hypothetical protein IIY93_06075 [Clostridia bacterium]|nr:hypothetical protein [Clostridia bacterium]
MRQSGTVARRARENAGGFVKVESGNGKIFMVNIETQKNEKKTGKGLHLAEKNGIVFIVTIQPYTGGGWKQ